MDIATILSEGSLKALIMHNGKIEHLPKLREIMKTEYQELLQVLNDALDVNMGEVMYKSILNTWMNAWAIKAIKETENGKEYEGGN